MVGSLADSLILYYKVMGKKSREDWGKEGDFGEKIAGWGGSREGGCQRQLLYPTAPAPVRRKARRGFVGYGN